MTGRMTASERLGDRHRPVDEIRVGRDQDQIGAITGKVAQRKERLESGDAAAGYQYAEGGRSGHTSTRGPLLGAHRPRRSREHTLVMTASGVQTAR